jgi:hypothetical protein
MPRARIKTGFFFAGISTLRESSTVPFPAGRETDQLPVPCRVNCRLPLLPRHQNFGTDRPVSAATVNNLPHRR